MVKKRGKKEFKGFSIKIHLTNRWLYTLIAIGILAIIATGIYAWADPITGVGHNYSEIQPCADGQILQFNTSTGWGCVDLPVIPTSTLKVKVIEIGDWNMDTTYPPPITHSLTISQIRDVTVIIRNDANTIYHEIDNSKNPTVSSGYFEITTTGIDLYRWPGEMFDSTAYDATGYNRGWVTIWYEE